MQAHHQDPDHTREERQEDVVAAAPVPRNLVPAVDTLALGARELHLRGED